MNIDLKMILFMSIVALIFKIGYAIEDKKNGHLKSLSDFLKACFLPGIKNSSIVVFHFTCIILTTFGSIMLFLNGDADISNYQIIIKKGADRLITCDDWKIVSISLIFILCLIALSSKILFILRFFYKYYKRDNNDQTQTNTDIFKFYSDTRLNDTYQKVFQWICLLVVILGSAMFITNLYIDIFNFKIVANSGSGTLGISESTGIISPFKRILNIICLISLAYLTTNGITELMMRCYSNGINYAPRIQKKIQTNINDIFSCLSSRNVDHETVDKTLLRSMHVLDELKLANSNHVNGVPDLTFIFSVDTQLPASMKIQLQTALFSQFQTLWSINLAEANNSIDISFDDESGEIQTVGDKSQRYYQCNDDDSLGEKLDQKLNSSIEKCVKNLIQNHRSFGLDLTKLKKIIYPRAIRLLFGTEKFLVELASSFSEYPKSAFPPLGHAPVLNVWISNSQRTKLFNNFDPDILVDIIAYLNDHGDPNPDSDEVFNNAKKFNATVCQPNDIDCLIIGTRLAQIGYTYSVSENRKVVLRMNAGLLPIIMNALEFDHILDFPNILRYISEKIGETTGNDDKSHLETYLAEQIDIFQNQGTYKTIGVIKNEKNKG